MDYRAVTANQLASLCANAGNQAAWYEFVQRFQRPIALVVLRTCRHWGSSSPSLIDDLVQETFLRLCADNCRLLKTFVAREPDSIAGFVKTIAANVTHDHFRGERSQKRGGLMHRFEHEAGDLDFLASPSDAHPAEKALRLTELDRALKSCVPDLLSEHDCTIFWLYFEQGFSAREISALPAIGLTTKGVESSIHRSTTQLRQRMQQPLHAARPAKGFSAPPTIYKENG